MKIFVPCRRRRTEKEKEKKEKAGRKNGEGKGGKYLMKEKYISLQRRRKTEKEKEENLSNRKMSRWADRQTEREL